MQDGCKRPFHLNLHFAVARIYVVELLFAAQPRVGLIHRIKRFGNLGNPGRNGREKSETEP